MPELIKDKETDTLEQNFQAVIGVLARLLELHDLSAGTHSRRVATASEFIAIQMNITVGEIADIKTGALLHDIGKISIPVKILQKDPAQLTAPEKILINEHPVIGEEILQPIEKLENARKIIRHHHENFDGSGWPDKISGSKIPMGSRIISVADFYDKVLYLPSASSIGARKEFALTHLENNAGKLYDPSVVSIFIEFLDVRDMVDSEMKEVPVPVTKIKDGMVLSRDFYTSNDLLVLTKDTHIGTKELERISQFNNISPILEAAYIYID